MPRSSKLAQNPDLDKYTNKQMETNNYTSAIIQWELIPR